MGAFLLGLVYSTKPDSSGPGITLTRRGDTAVVIDTLRKPGTPAPTIEVPGDPMAARIQTVPADSETGLKPFPVQPRDTARDRLSSTPVGSSFPIVVPADLEMLRRQAPAIPVAGIPASKLLDSFDDVRGGSRRHNAMDIMAPRKTPVVAAADGRILKLHNSTGGGLTIYASDPTSRYIFLYGHLDSYRPGIADGMAIRRGETIGFVGSTGNANPAGPHLHFAITRSDNLKEWWKGTPLNPFLIYRAR